MGTNLLTKLQVKDLIIIGDFAIIIAAMDWKRL